MNKQELIDKYVNLLNGKVRNHPDLYINAGEIKLFYPEGSLSTMDLCSVNEFERRARELGWIKQD